MVQRAPQSVKVFPALARATGATNLDIFQRKFVVVRQLFSALDTPQGKYDNVFLAKYVHNSRVAVGLQKQEKTISTLERIKQLYTIQNSYTYLARVIDEPGCIAMNCGVHHCLLINSKHVAAHPFRLVFFLSFIAQHGPNNLPSILNHHFTTL